MLYAGVAVVHGAVSKTYSNFLHVLIFPEAPTGWRTLRDGWDCIGGALRYLRVKNFQSVPTSCTVLSFVNALKTFQTSTHVIPSTKEQAASAYSGLPINRLCCTK